MKELTGHTVNAANEALKIVATDSTGAGGAHHRYVIAGFDAHNNPSAIVGDPASGAVVLFQNGPIPDKGTNGITQEALLEIVIDRLRWFQAGPFACRENAIALTKIEEAKMWLQPRTRNRIERGVEGTHQK